MEREGGNKHPLAVVRHSHLACWLTSGAARSMNPPLLIRVLGNLSYLAFVVVFFKGDSFSQLPRSNACQWDSFWQACLWSANAAEYRQLQQQVLAATWTPALVNISARRTSIRMAAELCWELGCSAMASAFCKLS